MWRHSPAASLTYPTWGSLRRARDPLSGSWQGRDPTSNLDESQRSEKPGGILLGNDWNCQAFLSSQQPAVSYQQQAARPRPGVGPRHQQKSEHLDPKDLPKALREAGPFPPTDKDGQGARHEQKLHRPRYHELIAPARGVRDLDLF